jgi:hypothetical protein
MSNEGFEKHGEAQRIVLEVDIVLVALRSSVRQAITRYQHEQACANGHSMNYAHFEIHTANVAKLEAALHNCRTTMEQLLTELNEAEATEGEWNPLGRQEQG